MRGPGQPHAPGDRGGGGWGAASQVIMTMIMMLTMTLIMTMMSGRDIGSMSWPPSPPGASTSGMSWAERGPSESVVTRTSGAGDNGASEHCAETQ